MGLGMNLLSIETATEGCAIGVRRHDGVEIVRLLDETRRHTEVLTSGIAEALGELGLSPRDLNAIVVDVGPGLFTGLRVGVATAISLGQALNVPLVSVTSLELLAWGAWRAGVRGTLVSAVDGRRGEVFVQTFTLADDVTAKSAPTVSQPRTTVITWATNGAPVCFTGDGVSRYFADFDAVPNGTIFEQDTPPQHEALALGLTREASATIAPLYLREADAVANFSTRERST
jgi:tRNA threonylcarbamoyladenosine biosynthesis protein TsaB